VRRAPAPRSPRPRRSPFDSAIGWATIVAALVAVLGFLGLDPLHLLEQAKHQPPETTNRQPASTRNPGALPVAPTRSSIDPRPSPTAHQQSRTPSQPRPVPTVHGLSEAEASDALRHAGLQVRVLYTPAIDGSRVGHVLAQAPSHGTNVRRGAVVTIVVGSAG
jgi:hypothetical protein